MSALLGMLAAAATPCSLPPGWDQVEARKTPYVVFGELHGTRQAPEFVGQVVCALARQKKRVLIALEIGAREDADLQAAWRLPLDRFAPAMLASVADWGPGYAGSAMSQAVLDMLVQLRREASRTRRIDIVAFNGQRDDAQRERFASLPGQGPHEASQAENIRIAAARGRYDKVIVLVGNYHARKRPAMSRGVSAEPMAMRLAPSDRVTSLNIAYASGTAWNCQMRPGVAIAPGGAVNRSHLDCGPHPTRGDETMSGSPRIEITQRSPAAIENGYDGMFWVGPIEAATPVAGPAMPSDGRGAK